MSHFHNCLEETIETSKRECGFFLVYAVSYLLGVKSQGEVIPLAFTLLLEQIESSGSPNLCRLVPVADPILYGAASDILSAY